MLTRNRYGIPEVPILAVCGSHQWLAAVYGGWEAVAHLAPQGEDPVRIADEAEGVFRAPAPRIGEVGAFGFRPERAIRSLPAFPIPCSSPSGTTIRCWKPALPAGAVSSAPARWTEQRYSDDIGPLRSQNRAHRRVLPYPVAALRCAAEGRILYTTQFTMHTESSDVVLLALLY